MIKILLGVGIMLVLISESSLSQGSVELRSFYSNSLERNRLVNVYTPFGYDPEGSIDYPVIYFLHGGARDHNSYPFIYYALDDLIFNNDIEPVILVKPNGNCHINLPHAGAFYTNSELLGNHEDYIANDLVEFIDSNYRTLPEPGKRYIMGHSCGAYGCMKIALKHPDIFGGVASHGGTPDLKVGLSLWRLRAMVENGGEPPFYFSPFDGVFSISLFGWAAAFSPNLGNQPYYVDFPLDSQGEIIDSIVARWQPNDPVYLARELSPADNPAIYFDCGTNDEFDCYPMNTSFAESLEVSGLTYSFQSYPGDHYNQLAARFYVSLAYFDSVMNSPTKIDFDETIIPSTISLLQNYPNPFNASTTIEYALTEAADVQITIYNILGRQIATLVDSPLPAGHHRVTWDAGDLRSGICFYRIQAGDYSRTKKMILLK
ncbi:MAG: T9SS type A sorting domain-containing protein [candidate division Zixibacteria bacterium]|nr:T9SS type A sorting domain-containing protein [candidate division Zixibacteria bacterium]